MGHPTDPVVSSRRTHSPAPLAPSAALALPHLTVMDQEEREARPRRELERIRGWLLRLVGAMELPANPLDQVGDLVDGWVGTCTCMSQGCCSM